MLCVLRVRDAPARACVCMCVYVYVCVMGLCAYVCVWCREHAQASADEVEIMLSPPFFNKHHRYHCFKLPHRSLFLPFSTQCCWRVVVAVVVVIVVVVILLVAAVVVIVVVEGSSNRSNVVVVE